MSIKDGGSAFPQTLVQHPNGSITHGADGWGAGGMTLRDYFAAKALQGELACQSGEAWSWPDSPQGDSALARKCYRMADAMIAAREDKL